VAIHPAYLSDEVGRFDSYDGEMTMAKEEHLKILKQGVRVWNRRRKGNHGIQPDPLGANLSEGGWSDREIAKQDQDRFGFQDYAAVLARRAATADTPLTLGIFGRWGSGKTSLMQLVRAELRKQTEGGGSLRTIWINVWQLSNQDQVWQAFLQAVFNEVNRQLRLWQRVDIGKLLRQLFINSYRIVLVITPMILGVLIAKPEAGWGDVVRLLLNPVAGAGTLLTVGLGLWTLLKPVLEAARQVVNFDLQAVLKYAPYEVQIAELRKLQERFEAMVEALVGKRGRLVVFIDDLDRCAPDKVPDVLEAIKLFTTTPSCVYVLGLDHDIVREGISAKYHFETAEEASGYLEKIVQIPFYLPPLDEGRMGSFVRDYYPDLQQVCSTAPDVFSKGLEPNPRKVKRALNIYRTLLELAEVRVKAWEMDPVDAELVAKMVVIESRFRTLHQHLVKEPAFLLKLEAKALSGDGPKRQSRAVSEEVNRVLTELGLVGAAGLGALNAMLRAGNKHFSDPDQRDQVSSYIYLIATTQGAAGQIRPNRREREALLGGDRAQIQAQVDEIAQRHTTDVYIEGLRRVLTDPARYAPAEKASANMALDRLESWERQEFEPLTVHVPAGQFLMGSSDDDSDADPDEHPQRLVELPAYRIGRYPVTNAEYAAFVEAAGHKPPESWEGRKPPQGREDHPIVNVNWHDAVAYCQWLAESTGKHYRLPSEAEWEKAARGTDGRIYPWGNDWDVGRCNIREGGKGDTTSVGSYPQGASPYGLLDMAGNVWEWTLSLHRPYPYRSDDGREDPHAEDNRVLRGGSWLDYRRFARVSTRGTNVPDNFSFNVGFRVVVAPV
jgi:formylglycine-generating enzyme required for sulfatase activity